jgi:hypothetical protein
MLLEASEKLVRIGGIRVDYVGHALLVGVAT